MDKTKTIRLSVNEKLRIEEELAVEHIKKQKEDADTIFHVEGKKFYTYISEDRIRSIVRDEMQQQERRKKYATS